MTILHLYKRLPCNLRQPYIKCYPTIYDNPTLEQPNNAWQSYIKDNPTLKTIIHLHLRLSNNLWQSYTYIKDYPTIYGKIYAYIKYITFGNSTLSKKAIQKYETILKEDFPTIYDNPTLI